MEQNCEVESGPQGLKAFLTSKRFLRPALAVLIGAVAGFGFHYMTYCTGTSCVLSKGMFMSMFWGSVMGLFWVNSPCARGRC